MPDEYGNVLGIYQPLRRDAGEVKAAMSFSTSSGLYDTSGWPGFHSFGQHSLDYTRTDASASSIVMQCLNWITRNFGQGRFEVVNYTGDDQTVFGNHPLTALIANPNTWYSSQRLWAGTLLDFNLNGNAYWLKVRPSITGKPRELWYVPSYSITPVWPEERNDIYISYYVHTSSRGEQTRIDVEDVVHFRNGIDPRNERLGLSPLRALLLEVFTDLEAGRFTAALLKNYGMPGVLVTPGENVQLTAEKAEHFRQQWERKFTGDNRGKTAFLNYQAKVDTIGFSPEQMNLEKLRRIPEERISGALGIPAIVAGLGAGLDRSTYSNTEQATAAAFEQNLMPTWYAFADEITNQLLVDYSGQPNIRAHFETQHIKALQENETEKQTRAREAFLAGGISRNQYREKIGEAAEDFDYILLPSNTSAREVKDGRMLEPLKEEPPQVITPPQPDEKAEELTRLRLVKHITEAIKAENLASRPAPSPEPKRVEIAYRFPDADKLAEATKGGGVTLNIGQGGSNGSNGNGTRITGD